MDRPYVERLRIQNYGCIQDAEFRLTPLHALIGPNDSGKSTVLRALRTMSVLAGQRLVNHEEQAFLQRALIANKEKADTRIKISVTEKEWQIASSRGSQVVRDAPQVVLKALVSSLLLRLDPDALRAPHSLIPEGFPLRFLDERGTGLPALYDAIMTRDLSAFLQLNEQLTRLFPNIKGISLINPNAASKAMGIKLVDGTFVPAELMSEGLLYYLAFAALPHLEPTALLLIEEPENGLHPARIAEVMRVLREIAKTTQILIATHSPLVVNELQPDEVTVVTRTRERGTEATLMKDTANFKERSKVYALGELWVSYANGEDEAPLLEGGPRP